MTPTEIIALATSVSGLVSGLIISFVLLINARAKVARDKKVEQRADSEMKRAEKLDQVNFLVKELERVNQKQLAQEKTIAELSAHIQDLQDSLLERNRRIAYLEFVLTRNGLDIPPMPEGWGTDK